MIMAMRNLADSSPKAVKGWIGRAAAKTAALLAECATKTSKLAIRFNSQIINWRFILCVPAYSFLIVSNGKIAPSFFLSMGKG
jgi:hypothetical protein